MIDTISHTIPWNLVGCTPKSGCSSKQVGDVKNICWRLSRFNHPWPTGHRGYSYIYVRCADRPKLLFDTVCTLADLQYSVFHATIDSAGGIAYQEYYVQSSITNSAITDRAEKRLVELTLRAAIARRSTKGVRIAIESTGTSTRSILTDVTVLLKSASLNITKSDYSSYNLPGHPDLVIYVMRNDGGVPTSEEVEAACRNLEASRIVDDASVSISPGDVEPFPGPAERMVRQWSLNWAGGK